MSRPLAVFCHVFTAGWREPLEDLIGAFNESGLVVASPDVHLGVVGPEVGRRAVLEKFRSECDLWPVVEAWEVEGNEAVTINTVRLWAQAHPGELVLYCHTKGASRPTEINRRWRRAMIEVLVRRWSEVLAGSGSFDAAGPFWMDLDSDRVAEVAGLYGWVNSFFGGNFWMARTDYLAGLPACASEPRGRGEEWVGSGDPAVLDLLPGFPDYEFFGLPRPAVPSP